MSTSHRPQDAHAVRAIIAAARETTRVPSRSGWVCGLTSALLWWMAFFPLNWGPIAFLAPVPLLLLARIVDRPRHLYKSVFLTWFAGSLLTLSWMATNPPMMLGWVALALYMALYPVLFLAGTRLAAGRLGWPLIVAAPLLWVGLEYLRAHLMTGFSWYYLGHTQWRWTTLIQISDLVGVYGVSFVVMAAATALALWIPRTWIRRLVVAGDPTIHCTFSRAGDSSRAQVIAMGSALALLGLSLAYGAWRLSDADFQTGPRVALAQGNFPSRLNPQGQAGPVEVWYRQNRLTAIAVPFQPDFVIWPESAFRWPVLDTPEDITDNELETLAQRSPYGRMTASEWRDASTSIREQLGDLATQANAAMLVGASALEADPDHGVRRFNSAIFSRPELGVSGRYDKQHRVMFGEYIPLREELPFMRALSPYTNAISIDAGEDTAVFEYAGYSISPVICFEDTVPHLVRNMVGSAKEAGKSIDLLVNVSNDGWFDQSAEQTQHLAISLFRAVETRTPLARSANTGVSAVIDGNGRIVEPVAFLSGDAALGEQPEELSLLDERGRLRKDVEAVLVADVPLDPRESLYVRLGDWFAGACLIVAGIVFAWGFWRRKQAPLAAY